MWSLLLFNVLAHDGNRRASNGAQPTEDVAIEHSAALFRHKDQVDVYLKNTVPSLSNIGVIAHGPRV
ncbi:hypothetical protein AKN88_01370 [Thiopseudomonas alkaliphila]|uniref:Uncharacterized protein n=1 Tax=Thiopseudomonas alkaliphila TaxID=1697053 RepID=A0A0K1XC31_9GAMM|nr:hypothetical protein AKN88_01370 [Thiopseudomonas alkaliphila]